MRSELEEQRAVADSRAAEKAALEAKVARLHALVLASSRSLLSTPLPSAAQDHSAQLPLSARPHSAHGAATALRRLNSVLPNNAPAAALLSQRARPATASHGVQAHAAHAHGESTHVAALSARSYVPPLWSVRGQASAHSASTTAQLASPEVTAGHSSSGAVLASDYAPSGGTSGFAPAAGELHATPRLTSALHSLQHNAAGELHTGPAGDLSLYEFESPYIAENAQLRQHLAFLIEELDRHGSVSSSGGSVPGSARGPRSALATGASSAGALPAVTLATAGGAASGAQHHRASSPAHAVAMPAAEVAAAQAAVHQRSCSDTLQAASTSASHAAHLHTAESTNSTAPHASPAQLTPKPPIAPLPPLWSAPSHTANDGAYPGSPLATPSSAVADDASSGGAGLASRLERAEARLAAAQRRLQAKEVARAQAGRALARFRALGQQLEAQLQAVTEVRRHARASQPANPACQWRPGRHLPDFGCGMP